MKPKSGARSSARRTSRRSNNRRIGIRPHGLAQRQGCREVHSRRLFVGFGPLDHAADALKQEDSGEPVVEPGQLPGKLHARCATTTDQPRLWLVIHVRIIGVRECRHGTGNIVGRASVEATSVVGDRARVRRFRRIRTVRISGTTSPDSGRTGGSLRASRIASPHWGHSGAVSGSFRTSIELVALHGDFDGLSLGSE